VRILHITEYCHAGSIGGTERYILDLIRGLDTAGIQNVIGWLKPGRSPETLESEGVRIATLPSPQMRVDAPLPEFHAAATSLLETEKPDWLHFHTFGLTEAALAKLAKERGIPYAFTYHSPAWTCRRETMLLYGQEPCDGEVRAWRCSACQSEERLGMGPLAGHAATAVSMVLGWAALPLGRTSIRRRAAFYYDSARFSRVIRDFLSECDLVVSCCDWSGPVLRRNGAREESIFLCPQGVPNAVADALRDEPKTVPASTGKEFVVGYVGRVTEIKGVHILMEGFSQMKADEARLRIVGYDANNPHLPYSQRLQKLAQADSRIELVPKKSFNDTLAEYQRLALLAIPSVSKETGPLTLLEALAVGVPVYGSNRVGQMRLLVERGRVVEPNTPDGWRLALEEACDLHRSGGWDIQRRRARGTGPIRTMEVVMEEVVQSYGRYLKGKASHEIPEKALDPDLNVSEKKAAFPSLSVNLAVCGRFHYHNYVRFLEQAGMLSRFYYAARVTTGGRALGIAQERAVNGFLKEYAVKLHARMFGERGRVLAYSFYHDLWQRHVLLGWRRADILHVMLHGNSRLLMARAREEGSVIIGEPVNAHPDELRELLNEEHERLGIGERLVADKIEKRLSDEAMRCDWLLAGSECVRKSFVRRGFPPGKTEVIPYGVDLRHFHSLSEAERQENASGLQPGKFRVICVAQIVPRKGHVYLLEAWKQLKLPDAELLLIGRLSEHMKPVLARYEGLFKHIPRVPNDKLRHYYGASDVFAMASIEDGFGYVCAEAMGCGLPVIATVNTGGAEVLDDGINGFKVPIRSPEALAEKIALLYQDRQKLQAMGKAAEGKARRDMGWDLYAEKLCAFYQKLHRK
jgi:glycosyltransferase involved in cell wall biosynthesis